MATKTLPPRELIHKLLSYDPVTGVFIWRLRPQEMFSTEHDYRRWNTRWAGNPAGGIGGMGYLTIVIQPHRIYAHRLAWLYIYGEPVPTGIDHKDGNPLNNRIANLRAASQSQNLSNKLVRKDSSTGIKGVQHHREKFCARIQCKGIKTYLGTFDTIEEAAAAYQEAAIRLFGRFARWE